MPLGESTVRRHVRGGECRSDPAKQTARQCILVDRAAVCVQSACCCLLDRGISNASDLVRSTGRPAAAHAPVGTGFH